MKYLIGRVAELLPVLLGVSVLIFVLTRSAPIDPAVMMLGQEATEEQLATMRHNLGLDLPIPIQYFRWMINLFQGSFGVSYLYGSPVTKELASRMPMSFLLAISGVFVTIIIGIPLGILSAVKRNSWIDHLVLATSLLGVSMPIFLLGFLLLWFLSYKIPIFPIAGWNGPAYLVLPSLAIGLPSATTILRLTRTAMLEILSQDYIRTAHAKGLSWWAVLTHHALRNALIPIVTVLGMQFGFLLNGSIVVEQVFSYPGVGSLVVNAVSLGDFPVVQAVTIVFTITYVMVNLVVDLSYGIIDPRIRTRGGRS